MPFDGSGIYTPPDGAINETPGAIIRSAIWNTIFTDLSTALTQVGEQLWTAPTTQTGNYTVQTTDSAVIMNGSGTTTLTLPTPSVVAGHTLIVKTIASQTVVSASANVAPIGSATPGTAILGATAGKWAFLKSDGTNWVIMMSN